MRLNRISLLVAAAHFSRAQFDPPDGLAGFEYTVFQTEPFLRAPGINLLNITSDLSQIQPGYLFLDPALDPAGIGIGPLIYDTYTAELVWDGKPSTNPDAVRTQNSHVCDYNGEEGFMCFTEWVAEGNVARHRVFDRYYQPVNTQLGWNGTKGFFMYNRHEFTMMPGGRTFLALNYFPIPWDLSELGAVKEGAILDACFQEIEVETEKELFRWCGTEHGLLPKDSPQLGHINLTQFTFERPWDYAHPNSIDKNEEGDYLMSIRYHSTVWKIAGLNATAKHGIAPGTVMWQLGGDRSDFTYDPPDAVQRWQHDARFVSTGKAETRISVFDNHNGPEGYSAGKIFSINNETKVATLVKDWRYPEPEECYAMGSNRIQPNQNMVIGWGQRPFFSEFNAKGDLLIHGTFKNDFRNASFNYRVTKGSWVGLPKTTPKVVAYSFRCSDTPLSVYASWNGATEIQQWRISISSSTTRPWVLLGTFPKTGFETKVEFSSSIISIFSGGIPRYVLAEALGPRGEVLGVGEVETFIPRAEVINDYECDEAGCHGPKHFLYELSLNGIHECKDGSTMSWFTIFSLFLGVEGFIYTYRNLWPVKQGAIHF